MMHYRFLLLLLVHCFVFSLQAAETTITKGEVDDRHYHYQVLSNQLQVLLISDPDTDKAAAALDVNVGSYDDPVERQGLAHFLEHMLFLGTSKYPDADEYQSFISDHGGSHNAYTAARHTNYFFDVDADSLSPALDRFSRFFIDPLFDPLYVDRERNAVHSEYQAKIRDDSRRSYDVFREVVNSQHPAAKFSVGSLETLADGEGDLVRDDLIAFYRQHYSADKMALVVLGKESIPQLQAMVLSRFANIPQRNTASTTQGEPLFLEQQLPMEVLIEPVKDIRQMSMRFSLSGSREYYREKPLDYIGHLLGHEGRGSLLSLLKQQGLAESLSAGGGDDGNGQSAFYVTIGLTEKGLNQRPLVRSLVFYALNQIREKGVEPWRYDEKRLLAELSFKFREPGDPIATVRHLANNLHDYAPGDVISGDYLLTRYDAGLIKRYLDEMQPGNVYIATMASGLTTDRISKHYRTPYQVVPLEDVTIPLEKSITSTFALPERNPFIPENTAVFPVVQSLQQPKLLDVSGGSLWARQDDRFPVPKASVFVRLYSPRVAGDLKGSAMNTLYIELLKDRLNEYNYPALLAGLSIGVSEHSRGMDIKLSGYSDKLHRLLELLVQEIDTGDINPARFTQLKEDVLRGWRNNEKKTPYHQLYNLLATSIYPLLWRDSDRITALESVTLEDIENFTQQWRLGLQVKGLLYGNISEEWAKPWQQQLSRLALGHDKPLISASVAHLQLEKPSYVFKEVIHNDQAVALYVQGAGDSLQDQALMMVLRQILQSPFYNSLRTEQQLGYIVFVGSLQLRDVPGSVFMVQSPTASVDQLTEAVQKFLKSYQQQLPDNIGQYQQAVLTQLLEAPSNLSAAADDYWDNILRDNLTFNSRQQLAEVVRQLTPQQIAAAYQRLLLTPTTQLWALSKPSGEANELVILPTPDKFYIYP